jgi:hypothetical protein
MKTILSLAGLIVLSSLSIRADIIVTLNNQNQTGSPGQTLSFFGTIANNGSDTNPVEAIYLNNDGFNLSLSNASYSLTDNFANTPLYLVGGQSSADIDLFDITLTDPQGDPFGLYGGDYTLLGGADGGANTAQDVLSQTGFSVTTVAPEPGTLALFTGSFLAVVLRGIVRRNLQTS